MQNNIIIVTDNLDGATFSGGDWETNLPLANLAEQRLAKLARSTDAEPASTVIRVTLTTEQATKVLALGPGNFSDRFTYRIKAFSDAFSTVATDTGELDGGPGAEWDAGTWDDAEGAPWDDNALWTKNRAEPGVGPWLIHVFDDAVTAQYIEIAIDDSDNADGYIDISRLFLGRYWQPSINYGYDDNGFSRQNNSLMANTLDGGERIWRRRNPRSIMVGFDYLPDSEAFGQTDEWAAEAGYDQQVFVMTDPSDLPARQKLSFVGTLREIDALTRVVGNYSGFGFDIREVIS